MPYSAGFGQVLIFSAGWKSPKTDTRGNFRYSYKAMKLPPHLQRLPYLVHTNRELGLMLRGIKPLARFSEGEGCFPDVVLRYLRLFDRYVASGTFVRRDEFVKIDHMKVVRLHYIYFALPGEEWRIQAMIDLLAQPGKWSLECERKEGELFGYTQEQNDIWIDIQRPNFQ
ncbi:MAG: hypothetical protein MRY59_13915 [Aquisalinus sp.]|nr:hypothetical protein [Aquisalinus sp.]